MAHAISNEKSTAGRRVLVVTRSFSPASHSGTLRIEFFCRSLIARGYQATVLTSSANLADAANANETVRSTQAELGEVTYFPWSHARPRLIRELYAVAARFPILWTCVRNSDRARLVRRACVIAEEIIRRDRPDAILATLPSAEALLMGVEIGRRHGLPVIADLRDPWSNMAIPLYRHYFDFLLERRLERETLSRCAEILVTCEACRTLLVEHVGVAPHLIRLVPNGYDSADFRENAPATDIAGDDIFVIAHIGALEVTSQKRRSGVKRLLGLDYDPLRTDYSARSAQHLLTGLEQCLSRRPDLRNRVALCLVGFPNATADPRVTSFPFENVIHAYPRVSSRRAAAIGMRSDLLALVQRGTYLNGRDFCAFIASKIYTYIKCNRSVLVCGQLSEISQLVERYQAGRFVRGLDPLAIGYAIEELIDAWLAGGGRFHQSAPRSADAIDRERGAEQLVEILERHIPATHAPQP